MADNSKKGGAGKFFLGAILGGLARAFAGRFIKEKMDEEDLDEDANCECGDDCKCEDKCTCEKKTTKKTSKPVAEKKTSEKK